MATNIEIEAKVLITASNYEKIMDHFKTQIESQYTQINYYIDTPNCDLRKHCTCLRIRNTKDKYELTLKTPLSEGLLEQTDEITKEDYENMSTKSIIPNGKIREFLIMLGYDVSDLKILASLTTLRTDIKVSNYSFSIDKNTYSDITDYELEREANNLDQAKTELSQICNECNIDFVINKVSKQARAMNAALKNK